MAVAIAGAAAFAFAAGFRANPPKSAARIRQLSTNISFRIAVSSVEVEELMERVGVEQKSAARIPGRNLKANPCRWSTLKGGVSSPLGERMLVDCEGTVNDFDDCFDHGSPK
jgi:hypothetical protein